MESNFLYNLLKKSAEFKKMQKDISEGKVPDGAEAIKFITEIPNALEKQLSGLKGADKKKADELLKQIREQANAANIFSTVADNVDKK